MVAICFMARQGIIRCVDRRFVVRVLVAAAFVAAIALAFVAGRWHGPDGAGGPSSRPSASVVLAMRDLSRLETEAFHVEKVIELTDDQSRLFGLVQAKDAILLVAVGDVVAGVDLAGIGDGDVHVDPETGRVRVDLPAPRVLSTSIDESQTRVVSRSTELLATRREDLESLARKEAAEQIEKAARDAGILARAQTAAERTVRALLQSLGFHDVVLTWR
jgi:hypothetical protein